MTIRKLIASVAAIFFLGQAAMTASASEGVQPLQAYFTDGGRTINIFTSEPLSPDASLLVGNERLTADEVTSDVKINTVFLVDNSTSMPTGLRDGIKTAVSEYVSSMPENESVKIAVFDTQTNYLAGDFSRDASYIADQLDMIDFQGQGSLVYDAVLNAAESIETSGAYCRTVLITDGIDSVEGTSFDYLRSVISENGRFHVDVVQVYSGSEQDVNLTAIAKLGSNTFTLFDNGTRFGALRPDTVFMIRVDLTNSVTTGELKGVTIKNSGSNIPLGSILFPQVEIEEPDLSETTAPAVPDSEPAADKAAESEPIDESASFPVTVSVIIGAVTLIIVLALVIVLIRRKKDPRCSIMVNIRKDDERDVNGVGMDVWRFRISSEFRVGRTLSPKDNNNDPLPKNDKAICENATNEDISSIGRNAFALTYDKRSKSVMIRNTAQGAVFTVETDGRRTDLKSGQIENIAKGTKILLGNYTTVIIHNINVS